MMDMGGLILAADVQVRAAGRVEDPPEVAQLLAELRAVLLSHPAGDRAALIRSLKGILKQPGDVADGQVQPGVV